MPLDGLWLRAPYLHNGSVPTLRDLLEPSAIQATGIFDASAVSGLLRRCQAGLALGTRESQALVGVLSTQLWYQQFMTASHAAAEAPVLLEAS